MAFSLGSNGGGNGKRRFGASMGTMSEINIVPLVDVVLVLLIIFMLTAQVMEYGLDIHVPEVRPVASTIQERPVVSLRADGRLQLNDNNVKLHAIPSEIERRFKNTKAVYVVADRAVTWDVLAQVVAELGEAKLEVSLVTKPLETTSKK
jgi:biopolymer transport protein ExbD